PYSLFESVTKYGLELALLLPALEACDEYSIRADVRWGKAREALAFRHEGGARNPRDDGMKKRSSSAATREAVEPRYDPSAAPRLRDDVAALVEGFAQLDSPWRARESRDVLDLPGLGVCVPDLVFEHERSKKRVYFEALGYWSRDAAWRRVELAR